MVEKRWQEFIELGRSIEQHVIGNTSQAAEITAKVLQARLDRGGLASARSAELDARSRRR